MNGRSQTVRGRSAQLTYSVVSGAGKPFGHQECISWCRRSALQTGESGCDLRGRPRRSRTRSTGAECRPVRPGEVGLAAVAVLLRSAGRLAASTPGEQPGSTRDAAEGTPVARLLRRVGQVAAAGQLAGRSHLAWSACRIPGGPLLRTVGQGATGDAGGRYGRVSLVRFADDHQLGQDAGGRS
jgi:hypothetical protein